MEASTQAVDLTSLPSDVLLEILKDCDKKLLYHLAWTCRALHIAALTILFRHHAKSLDQGILSLVNPPDFILPAVHGALFVRDLKSIYIHLRNDVAALYRDLHIIKDLIARSTSLIHLTLNFTGLGAPKYYTTGCTTVYTTVDKLCKALQELMDLAIEKNCEWLDIMSDTGIQRIFPPAAPIIPPLQSISERPRKSKILSQLFGKVGHVIGNRESKGTTLTSAQPNILSAKPSISISSALSQRSIKTSGSDLSPEATSPTSPNNSSSPAANFVTQATPDRYLNTRLDSITFSSQLWFEEPMWDWTFNILKSPKIVMLYIDQDSLLPETWLKALPLVHIPTLRQLEYTAVKQPVPMMEFTTFMIRHAPHIRHLTLLLHPFPPKQTKADTTDALDFQSLRQLRGGPSAINWVLAGAKAACLDDATSCLPQLNHLSFQEPRAKQGYISGSNETETDWTEIDTAFIILSSLAFQQISPVKERWLTTLEIQCIDSFGNWLKPHITNPSISPLASLSNVTDLTLYKGRHFEDSEVEMFPKLWAFFPELKQVSIRMVWLDQFKAKCGVKYWKRVRRDCPKLKDVDCNWTVDFKVEDLLRDDWPERIRW